VTLWALLHRSESRLDGYREYLCYENCLPVLFRSRAAARAHAQAKYGYFKREDLRAEPHGWRMPTPVRVSLNYSFKAAERE
jgi:hypothetical protein